MPRNQERNGSRFLNVLDAASGFADRCNTAQQRGSSRPGLRIGERAWAHEVALLKVWTAWEVFLEHTLAAYVIGESAPGGRTFARRRTLNTSHPEALRILRGDRDFVGWSSPEAVITRSEAWLRDGEPFSTSLAAASQSLSLLRAMRNAVCHESEAAITRYLSILRKRYGAAPRFSQPGRVLMGRCPPIRGLTGPDLFTASMSMFRAVAQQILP